MNCLTPQAADANHARLLGDLGVIPEGMYCYSRATSTDDPILNVVPCPYWGSDPEKRTQQNGYCAHLKAGDWEDGTFLLWDLVKECGVNNDFDEGKLD